jgi:hypothetical protein
MQRCNNMTDINKLREEIDYDPRTGLFTWLKRGRGRALGAFIGTPVVRTIAKEGSMAKRDPTTGEYIYDEFGYIDAVTIPAKIEHRGYVIRINGTTYPAHTLGYALQTNIWAKVSHLNGDKEDNRFTNLTTDRDKSFRFRVRNDVLVQQKAQELITLRDSAKRAVSVEQKEMVALISALYQYNPEEGLFMRLGTKYQNWDKGTPVRSNNSRSLYFKDPITKASRSCPCHVAAFILHTGVYPEGRVTHLNGDKNDNRWENLHAG